MGRHLYRNRRTLWSLGNALNLDLRAVRLLLCPQGASTRPPGALTVRIINLTVVFQRTVVDFFASDSINSINALVAYQVSISTA